MVCEPLAQCEPIWEEHQKISSVFVLSAYCVRHSSLTCSTYYFIIISSRIINDVKVFTIESPSLQSAYEKERHNLETDMARIDFGVTLPSDANVRSALL